MNEAGTRATALASHAGAHEPRRGDPVDEVLLGGRAHEACPARATPALGDMKIARAVGPGEQWRRISAFANRELTRRNCRVN